MPLLLILLTNWNTKEITRIDFLSGCHFCLLYWQMKTRGLNRLSFYSISCLFNCTDKEELDKNNTDGDFKTYPVLLLILTERDTSKITHIEWLRHCFSFNCSDKEIYGKDYTDWVLKILTVFMNVLTKRNTRKVTHFECLRYCLSC